MAKKKLRVIGIIDKEGFEIDNRVYDRGGCPTQRAGNMNTLVIRKYEKTDNRSGKYR